MGKTKFGTKIVFVFVILLGAGAVLYVKNCMEQIAAYAVSLTDSATQAQAQSQQQAGKQAAGAPVQSENDMHVDNDIPEQSQSRGHRR